MGIGRVTAILSNVFIQVFSASREEDTPLLIPECRAEGFVPEKQKRWLVVDSEAGPVLDALALFEPAEDVSKWI